MANTLVAGILVLLVGLAVFYIVKAKKSGVKCIGCPSCGTCAGKHEACGCQSPTEKKENKKASL